MVGELIVTFCEGGQEGPSRWLEVWSFPDDTLNLVIASAEVELQEYYFPCSRHMLQAVAAGCDYQIAGPAGYVFLRREGERLCAEFRRSDDRHGWSQCVPLQEFQVALAESGRGAYLG